MYVCGLFFTPAGRGGRTTCLVLGWCGTPNLVASPVSSERVGGRGNELNDLVVSGAMLQIESASREFNRGFSRFLGITHDDRSFRQGVIRQGSTAAAGTDSAHTADVQHTDSRIRLIRHHRVWWEGLSRSGQSQTFIRGPFFQPSEEREEGNAPTIDREGRSHTHKNSGIRY